MALNNRYFQAPWGRWVTRAALVAALLTMSLTSGCGWFTKSGQEIEAPPQTLAYEGIEQLEAENYKTAAETFQKIKDRYPYSKYALLAELKMADALFLKTSYIEAAEAYKEFARLHPHNEAVPYCLYQQGICYYKAMGGHDRDQTPAVNAIQTFNNLRENYPNSDYAAMAMPRIVEAQNSLAGHEFSIGEFYFKMEAYKAALGRFISLVKAYPDTGYHARALEYIRVCQDKLAEQAQQGGKKEVREFSGSSSGSNTDDKTKSAPPMESPTGETGGGKLP